MFCIAWQEKDFWMLAMKSTSKRSGSRSVSTTTDLCQQGRDDEQPSIRDDGVYIVGLPNAHMKEERA